MKKFVVILLAVMFVLSCEEEVEGPSAPPGTMIVKLNGVSLPPKNNWPGLLPHVTGFANIYADGSIRIWGEFHRVENGTTVGGGEIIITLDSADEGCLAIRGNCPVEASPGNVYYHIEPGSIHPIYYATWRVEDFLAGAIVITKLDRVTKLISGTFGFKLRHTHTNEGIALTEGSFTDLPLLP